jgi:hypothetical protein
MTELKGKPTMRGAVAGSLLVGTIVLGAGVGAGIGALIGAAAPLALLGFFVGLVAGFALVRSRFSDL